MTDKKTVVSISLRQDQIDLLDNLNAASRVSKSELIRQCLDRAMPDLTKALAAMQKHGFGPTETPERKPARKKTQRKPAAKKQTATAPVDDSDESPAYKKWKELL